MKRKYHGPRAAWRRFETSEDLTTISAETGLLENEGLVDDPSTGGGGGGGSLDTGGSVTPGRPW